MDREICLEDLMGRVEKQLKIAKVDYASNSIFLVDYFKEFLDLLTFLLNVGRMYSLFLKKKLVDARNDLIGMNLIQSLKNEF